jgi:hypothetical protein
MGRDGVQIETGKWRRDYIAGDVGVCSIRALTYRGRWETKLMGIYPAWLEGERHVRCKEGR